MSSFNRSNLSQRLRAKVAQVQIGSLRSDRSIDLHFAFGCKSHRVDPFAASVYRVISYTSRVLASSQNFRDIWVIL